MHNSTSIGTRVKMMRERKGNAIVVILRADRAKWVQCGIARRAWFRIRFSLQTVPFAFAIERAGVNAKSTSCFLNGHGDGQNAADVLGFELIQGHGGANFDSGERR